MFLKGCSDERTLVKELWFDKYFNQQRKPKNCLKISNTRKRLIILHLELYSVSHDRIRSSYSFFLKVDEILCKLSVF